MAKYAAGTQVAPSKSVQEIESTLERYGADQFAYMKGSERVVIAFVVDDMQVRFVVELPDPASREFTTTPTGLSRSASAAREAFEKAIRQRWRALALVVKAKLEAVDSGIVTFEQEFFAHIVLPGGKTVYDTVAPAVETARLGNPDPMLRITDSIAGDD